jgi:integrase
MPRSFSLRLRVHKASGRLYKTIGHVLGRDGTPKKKTWYFDPADPAAAVAQTVSLKARWKALRAAGKVVWDEDPIYQDEHARAQREASNVTTAKPVTVADAVKLYLGHLENRMNAGQITRQHFRSQSHRLNAAVEPLTKLPLSVVGGVQLQRAVLRLAERPTLAQKPRTTGKGKAQTPRPLSCVYARACIATLKWFCLWADESDLTDWRKPSNFSTIFKAKPAPTQDERQKELTGDVDRFTTEEIGKLWTAANGFQRLLILLGTNCAFSSAEISTLRADQVNGMNTGTGAAGGVTIERFRTKTVKTAGRGSYGLWHLWPETIDHLQRHLAPANKDGLALLNEAGKPLVIDHADYRQDAIGNAWQRLLKQTGVRPLSFKFLRKTAAHLVRVTLGHGSEVAEMLLAHADVGMIRFYAGRDWNKLKVATDRMHVLLSPVFTVIPNSESGR